MSRSTSAVLGAALARARVLALPLAVAAAPCPAAADADEASVAVHALGGLAVLGDAAAAAAGAGAAATDRAALAGLTARASYATRDWLQYELGATVAGTATARYAAGHFAPPDRPPLDGAFATSTLLARLELGVALRLGVRVIPCLRVFAGPQLRRRGGAEVAGAPVRDPAFGVDLVGGAGVGVDYRLGRRLIVGVAAAATSAIATGGDQLHTIELTAHVSYYWYTRW
jgi:hypothetical protein